MTWQRNVGRSTLTGIAVGLPLAVGLIMLSYWCSNLPAISAVSLRWSFTPWWRHWNIALIAFLLPTLTGMTRDSLDTLRCR